MVGILASFTSDNIAEFSANQTLKRITRAQITVSSLFEKLTKKMKVLFLTIIKKDVLV